MFVDARNLSNHSVIETDIAIIGCGPAGITFAQAFANQKVSICIIESGGHEPEQQVQDLYDGESTGISYSLRASRLRYLGGSSNHWGGYCRPLDVIDFEKRDWVPYSGWPISQSELTGYYSKAAEIINIAPAKFTDTTYWQEKSGEKMLPRATGNIELQFVQYSSPPMKFQNHYQNVLENSTNIKVLLHANVTNIKTSENTKTVTSLDIKTLTGLAHIVKAKLFILATGGLENARLLLLSRDGMSQGLGNQNDMVGRFFMEHPHFSSFCEMVVANLKQMPKIYYSLVKVENRPAQVAFKPTESYLRERRLLNASFQFGLGGAYRTVGGKPHPEPEHASAHKDMLLAARPFLTKGTNIPDSNDPSVLGVWLGAGSSCEQIPNPDSRVTLSDKVDALGQQHIKLNWKLTEQDWQSYISNLRATANEFGALGLGRMYLTIDEKAGWPQDVRGGSHHMGTTRMSDDPKTGVVDKNCKVHDIENLYVAGSSVFTTSGTANPTLTIVALALRLAEHIKGKLA